MFLSLSLLLVSAAAAADYSFNRSRQVSNTTHATRLRLSSFNFPPCRIASQSPFDFQLDLTFKNKTNKTVNKLPYKVNRRICFVAKDLTSK